MLRDAAAVAASAQALQTSAQVKLVTRFLIVTQNHFVCRA